MKNNIWRFMVLLIFGMLLVDSPVLMAFESNTLEVGLPSDNKKVIEAYMRQAKHFMEKSDYVSAKNKLEKVLELDENHAEAMELLAVCEEKMEQQRAVERAALNSAINSGSIQSLRSFIEQYPKSEFVGQAENCIEDFELWATARQNNTKAAYQEYLSKSKVMGYEDEANEKERGFEAEEAWANCHNSIEKLEDFVDKYYGTTHSKDAQYELNLLYAERYYKQKEHYFALIYYKKAKEIHALNGEYLKHFNELQQEEQFNKLKNSYVLTDLIDFLKHLSVDSPYYNPISNKIAIIKANNLTSYSTEMDMDVALNYAKDDATKAKVKERILEVKKRQRERKRETAKKERKIWWKDRVTFGWNIIGADFDPEFDISSTGVSSKPSTYSLETGLRLRFGRFNDIINITIGLDYQNYKGKYVYQQYYYDEAKYSVIHRRLAPQINFKLNMAPDYKRAFYLGCSAEFGYEIEEIEDYFDRINSFQDVFYWTVPSIAIEPQIGFNHKHFDWGIYYRCYLDGFSFFESEYSDGNNRIGMYITIYF